MSICNKYKDDKRARMQQKLNKKRNELFLWNPIILFLHIVEITNSIVDNNLRNLDEPVFGDSLYLYLSHSKVNV